MESFSNKCNLAKSIIPFYLGQCSNIDGRMIHDIYSWDQDKLEHTHNYIQWLFPLKKKSSFNPDAPVLNAQEIKAFQADRRLKSQLIKSFRLMLDFYGLQFNDMCNKGVEIIKSPAFLKRKRIWLTKRSHNYLRITRILKSLRLLGLEDYAQAFFKCLNQLYNEESDAIGDITYRYWQRAIT